MITLQKRSKMADLIGKFINMNPVDGLRVIGIIPGKGKNPPQIVAMPLTGNLELTQEEYLQIMTEAVDAGWSPEHLRMKLAKPVLIYTSANSGPSGSKAYVVEVVTAEFLKAVEEN